MCTYCKAASAVLDLMWHMPEARNVFATQGVELNDLGPLVHEVFVPAYKAFKNRQDADTLSKLNLEVGKQMIGPKLEKDTFREAWNNWGDQTRGVFLREQIEARLAIMLLDQHPAELIEVYKGAYAEYKQQHPQNV
jgi:hypothetical protein